MKIAYLQYGNTNPFQVSYFGAAKHSGANVRALEGQAFLSLTELETIDILHLDWLHPLYKSRRGRLAGWFKTQRNLKILNTAKRRFGLKIVHTVHNLLSHDSFLSPHHEQRVIQSFLSLVDGFAVFSEPVAEQLKEMYSIRSDQTHFVTPHGHYIDSYSLPSNQPSCRAEFGIPDDTTVILFFGALRDNKGVLDLLEVFPEVNKNTEAHLVIAGGHPTPEVQKALNNQHPAITLFPHEIDSKDVGTFFRAADLVALPFRSALNSGSAILAASLGKFSILPEIKTVYANLDPRSYLTFEPGNLDALRDTLISATNMSRQQLHDLGDEARDYVRHHLDWAQIGKRIMHMYEQLLDGHHQSVAK